MDESLICSKLVDVDVFQRRIEFHLARKPFIGFSSNNSPDFQLETLNPTSSSSDYTLRSTLPLLGSTKKSDAGREHGIDPELCFGITFRRIGAGLENLGNTCFLNSVLQCLTYTEPFAAYLQSGKHKSSCHTAGFCAMCALQNHVNRALQSTGRILAPKDLVMNLRCISRNFRNARQEDAHEYMVNLLESMHKCCLPSGVPSESPSAYEKSLVHKIFGGRLRSQVKCMQCSYCSNTFDPFLDLSLEIMKAESLRKALSHFTAVEQLDGGEREYQCQRCKQKVKALKQLTVHKAPYVLSIHLKRFGSHVRGQKIDKKVDFGPTLDLKPFVSGSHEGDLKYTLYGVLVHAGWSTHSGHYYCFVRTSSGMWHSLDDNRVVQVSEKTVLQQKAYMLFYVRDKQNFVPRKPIDRKENGVPSIIDNRELCAFEAVQTGPLATGLHTLDLSKKQQLKESSTVKITMGLVTEEGTRLKVPVLQSSSMALAKGVAVKQPINGSSVEDVHSKSIPSSIEGKNCNSYPPVATSGTKTDRECLRQGSNTVAAPSCSGSQSSGPKKHVVNDFSDKSDIVADKEMLSGEPQKKVNDLKAGKHISPRLSNISGLENNQEKGGSISGELACQKVEYNNLTSMETKLEEPSTKVCKMTEPVQKKAPGHHHNIQKRLMPKRKVIKSRIASMHLGTRFLMKASLSLYKKRKQERNRRQSLELKNHNQEKFGEDSTSGGMEPSTSEKLRITDLVSVHSKRRRRKSSAEKRNGQRATKDVETFKESAVNVIEGSLRERIYQNNSVLASNEPLRHCSTATSEGKQRDPREPDTAQVKKGLFENGTMSMLTRGLEEFTVARWDEMESAPSQHLGSTDAKSIHIGYVPDEWDEEYDRGKRKKVRNPKDSFDNSNPFQEIANKKAKLGNTKVDGKYGNQPFEDIMK